MVKITDVRDKKAVEFHEALGEVVFGAIENDIALDIIISKLELLKTNLIYCYISDIAVKVDKIKGDYLKGYV